MRNAKRILTFVLGLVFILSFLTGCKNSVNNSNNNKLLNREDPVIIEVWTYYKDRPFETFNAFIKEFNETIGLEHGIIIKQSSFGEIDALTSALLSANKSDGGSSKMPDMFISFKGVATMLRNVEFVDFRDYLTEKEIDSYVDAFVTTGATVHSTGNINQFSIGKASEILLINQTEFERLADLGVLNYSELENYESLAAMAQRYYEYTDSLTEEEGDGKALFGVDSLVNLVFLTSAELGHNIISLEDGKEKIDLSRRDVFEIIYKYICLPYIRGYFDLNSRYVTDDIRSGNLLLGQCATSAVPFFPKHVVSEGGDMVPISGKVMVPPHFRDSENYFLIQGGGAFGIKHSEKSALAMAEFLKWLTNDKNAISFSMSLSYLPPLKSSFSEKVVKESLDAGLIDELLADTYTLMFDSFGSLQAYEPMATENYELVRKIINDYMIKSINDGRILYGEGAGVDSEEYFEEWYSGLKAAIDRVMTESTLNERYIGE